MDKDTLISQFQLAKLKWDRRTLRLYYLACIELHADLIRKQYHPRTNPNALTKSKQTYDHFFQIYVKREPSGNCFRYTTYKYCPAVWDPHSFCVLHNARYQQTVHIKKLPNIATRTRQEHDELMKLVRHIETNFVDRIQRYFKWR